MKKTLIASAVAAATLSSGAFAESAPVTSVFGSLEVAYTHTENGSDETSNDVADNGSTIGFSHEHSISEGLTGFATVEFAFAADDGGDGEADDLQGLNVVDTALVGVKGDFGELIYAATEDTVYDWIDVVDTYEAVGLGGGIAEGDLEFAQYVSPEIAEGLTLGAALPLENDSNFGGALAAKYTAPMVEGLEVALAYQIGKDQGTDLGQDTLGLGASYTMDDITVLGQFESKSESASDAGDDSTYLALQGMYAMGQNQFALGYGRTNFSGDNGIQAGWYLQALHNVSDNMYVYFEFMTETNIDTDEDGAANEGADLDSLVLGATYSF